MDLIQTLKKADGKPVRRPCWPDGKNIFDNGLDIVTESGADIILNSTNMLADDWYVVESLDDVIGREAKEAAVALGVGCRPDVNVSQHIIASRMRRVLAWQAENGK